MIYGGIMVYGYMVFNVVHLNGILGQHGAVQLHWRKGQLLKRFRQFSGLEEFYWMCFGVF